MLTGAGVPAVKRAKAAGPGRGGVRVLFIGSPYRGGGPDRGEKLGDLAYLRDFQQVWGILARSRAEEALSLLPAGSPDRQRPQMSPGK